jgi:hypothetical protein
MPLTPEQKRIASSVATRLFESFMDSVLEQGEEFIDEVKARVRKTRKKMRRPKPPRE